MNGIVCEAIEKKKFDSIRLRFNENRPIASVRTKNIGRR